MARGGKRLAREEEMRAVLEKWERSGLPVSSFAEREGIARKTMYRWRRRLQIGDDRMRRGRPPAVPVDRGRRAGQSASIFTEVSTALRAGSSSAVTFEVVLRDGRTLRVPEHFESGALRRLLATLREC